VTDANRQSGEGQGGPGGGLDELRAVRQGKVDALRDAGVDPYPDRFERSATSGELRRRFGDLPPGSETTVVERVAGRVMLSRRMGKLQFLTLRDADGTFQLFVSRAVIGEEGFAAVAERDLGDWVGAEGEVMTTTAGEWSIKTTAVALLAKAVRPLPDKWRGLADTDTRYRQRYVDLLVNDDARRTFAVRHATIAAMRRLLDAEGFVEVETPILQLEAGGATARPFVTHHNALDVEMYLRIATELHLKRLVVGGLERVYEIGRIFRNEGIDTRHNPEFTMVEIYQALANYHDMMALTERLVAGAAQATLGTVVLHPGAGVAEGPGDITPGGEAREGGDAAAGGDGGEIDLTPPWPRRRLVELIDEHLGVEVDVHMDVPHLRRVCDDLGVAYEEPWGAGRLVYTIFDKRVEERVGRGRPVFVCEYPAEVSPLAKPNAADPEVVDRFELVVGGRELANGYSELNDPVRQLRMFEA
jgi:lysyl-tRNA synthetase class 2